jgi:hypothetical protein
MKMTYAIVAEMSAAGAGGHRFLRRHEDADDRVIIFQTYEEAVKRCEELKRRCVGRLHIDLAQRTDSSCLQLFHV